VGEKLVPSLGKSQSFPPSKAEDRVRRSEELMYVKDCPPYGSKSVIGRRAKMEDACVAVPFLIEVPLHCRTDELLPPRIAPQLRSSSGSSRSSEAAYTTFGAPYPPSGTSGSGDGSELRSTSQEHASTSQQETKRFPPGLVSIDATSLETLHFFGVFDGHGGADAAMHCAKTLHERVKEVFQTLTSPTTAEGAEIEPVLEDMEMSSSGTGSKSLLAKNPTQLTENSDREIQSTSSGSSFLDAVDIEEPSPVENLAEKCSAGVVEGVHCTTETIEAALTKAFHLTDEEFGEMGGYEHLALVGTTAVVALVGTRMIYVANCGDSRAVLCRQGQAVPLTDDHKAAREDETARVEAAGGQILFWNGVRVMGLLAVSRAIGDHSLRPYVIAEPEVTIVNRQKGDELLVLASDGLWDVMSNQEACTLAKKCLLRARQRGSSRQSAARVAATVLTRAAVDRGSRDNVTVVIVDLSPPTEEEKGKGGLSHDGSLDFGPPETKMPDHGSMVASSKTSHNVAAKNEPANALPIEQSRQPVEGDEPDETTEPLTSSTSPALSPFDMPQVAESVAVSNGIDGAILASPFGSGEHGPFEASGRL
jgi:protein phosphatase 2C